MHSHSRRRQLNRKQRNCAASSFGDGLGLADITGLRLAKCLLVGFLTVGPATPQLPADADTWIELYGVIDESSELVRRARRVFEQVKAAADKRGKTLPSLVLVKRDPVPSAVSLPGGAIVVSEEALVLCYGRRGERLDGRGDARLAFLLGHELAHYAHDDHREAFAAIRQHGDTESARVVGELPSSRLIAAAERRADYYGLHYLLTAGFDPHALLQGENDFFQDWVEKLAEHGLELDSTSPTPEERARLLRDELRALAAEYPLFHLGVRLLQLQRYEDGIRLLEAYRSRFAGREVLNNLGVGYYQVAAKRLAECDGRLLVRFWLPQVIDPKTVVGRSRLRGAESPCYSSLAFQREIGRAIEHLEAAAKASPTYRAARLNLASALLLADRASQALGPAKEALDLEDDALSRTAYAVALYRVGVELGLEATETALAELDQVGDDDPGVAYAHYNRAAILADRGRMTAAGAALKAFLEIEREGPWARVARERLGKEPPVLEPAEEPVCELPKPSLLLGRGGELGPRALEGWSERRYRLGRLPIRILERGSEKALEIDGSIELIEHRLSPSDAEGLAACGPPRRVIVATIGEIHRYRKFALEIRDQVPLTILHVSE